MISHFVVNSIWIYPTLMREVMNNFQDSAELKGQADGSADHDIYAEPSCFYSRRKMSGQQTSHFRW